MADIIIHGLVGTDESRELDVMTITEATKPFCRMAFGVHFGAVAEILLNGLTRSVGEDPETGELIETPSKIVAGTAIITTDEIRAVIARVIKLLNMIEVSEPTETTVALPAPTHAGNATIN